LLSAYLYQKGSPESKDPDADEDVDHEADGTHADAPWPVRAGGAVRVVYEHSLAIALLSLFALSLILHVIGGAAEYDRQQIADGRPTTTAMGFLFTPEFWFQSLQNWQSEFLSVGVLVVLTGCLRPRGSPESKPMDEAHRSNG